MMFRNIVVILATACMSSNAFVPSRSLISVPKVVPTLESHMTSSSSRFSAAPLQKHSYVSRSSTARFMSDAVAETPEPEKKNLMEKVS